MKAIDNDLHCYHFYGNNASRFIFPNITNKVRERKRVGLVFHLTFFIFKLNIIAPLTTSLDEEIVSYERAINFKTE